MKRPEISTMAAMLCMVASTGFAQSITVSFLRTEWDCDGVIPAGSRATWYITAMLGGASLSGITGAEFRQDGTPPGWLMTAAPDPAASLVWGDPLAGGCNIAWPGCQTGSNGLVVLYTVEGMATSSVGLTCLTVNRHITPNNPQFHCPVQILCDAPIYTAICVAGGEGIINGECFVPHDCSTTAVEVHSWSHVKSLYE